MSNMPKHFSMIQVILFLIILQLFQDIKFLKFLSNNIKIHIFESLYHSRITLLDIFVYKKVSFLLITQINKIANKSFQTILLSSKCFSFFLLWAPFHNILFLAPRGSRQNPGVPLGIFPDFTHVKECLKTKNKHPVSSSITLFFQLNVKNKNNPSYQDPDLWDQRVPQYDWLIISLTIEFA